MRCKEKKKKKPLAHLSFFVRSGPRARSHSHAPIFRLLFLYLFFLLVRTACRGSAHCTGASWGDEREKRPLKGNETTARCSDADMVTLNVSSITWSVARTKQIIIKPNESRGWTIGQFAMWSCYRCPFLFLFFGSSVKPWHRDRDQGWYSFCVVALLINSPRTPSSMETEQKRSKILRTRGIVLARRDDWRLCIRIHHLKNMNNRKRKKQKNEYLASNRFHLLFK